MDVWFKGIETVDREDIERFVLGLKGKEIGFGKNSDFSLENMVLEKSWVNNLFIYIIW